MNNDNFTFTGSLDDDGGPKPGDGMKNQDTLFNLRDWLQSTLEEKGARITGKGLGMGYADLSILFEGCQYAITITPTIKGDG